MTAPAAPGPVPSAIPLTLDGRAVTAPRAGCVLFPFPESQVDQEWFYLAEFDAPAT